MIGVMDMLSMRIPPFIRIDLFQIILTQALSLGNISQNVIKSLPFFVLFFFTWIFFTIDVSNV